MTTTPAFLPPGSIPEPLDLAGLAYLLNADWGQGVTMRTSYATGISRTKGGNEQRVALRGIPIREISYVANIFSVHDMARVKRQAMRETLSRRFVPLPCDKTRLSAPVSLGATSLPCDTTDRRFVPGAYVAVSRYEGGSLQNNMDVLKVSAVSPTGLTVEPTTRAYVKNDDVVPLMVCDLSPKVSGAVYTTAIGAVTVQGVELSQASMLDTDQAAGSMPAGENTAYGLPVLPFLQDYSGPQSWGVVRDVLTSTVGNAETMQAFGERGRLIHTLSYTSLTKAECRRILRFYESRLGQCLPFFMASPTQDFANVDFLSPSQFECDKIRNLPEWADQPYVAVVYTDGRVEVRKKVSVTNGATTSTVTLDSDVTTFGVFFVTAGLLCRFASDTMEERWITDAIAATSFDVEEIEIDFLE